MTAHDQYAAACHRYLQRPATGSTLRLKSFASTVISTMAQFNTFVGSHLKRAHGGRLNVCNGQ